MVHVHCPRCRYVPYNDAKALFVAEKQHWDSQIQLRLSGSLHFKDCLMLESHVII